MMHRHVEPKQLRQEAATRLRAAAKEWNAALDEVKRHGLKAIAQTDDNNRLHVGEITITLTETF